MEGDIEKYAQLAIVVKKALRQDKRAALLESVREDLDIKDMRLGLIYIKRGYKPVPYHKKNRHGEAVRIADQAEALADYLHAVQWKAMSVVPTIDSLPARSQRHYLPRLLYKYEPNYNCDPPA